jgi:hypothetical protein
LGLLIGARGFLLPDINQSSDHGLVVLWLEDVVEADGAAEDIPCGDGQCISQGYDTEYTHTLYKNHPNKALQSPTKDSLQFDPKASDE